METQHSPRADYFEVEGRTPLSGEVIPSGNKNAALPILAACLLSEKPQIIRNVPDILDVMVKIDLLRKLGVIIEHRGDHSFEVSAKKINRRCPDRDLASRIRTSLLLAAPLLYRRGTVRLPRPGGDQGMGRRRPDTHFLALEAFGVRIEITDAEYIFRMPPGGNFTAASLYLDEMSVTGTEQAVLAAVLAKGESEIINAASEPHVQDLCHFLNKLGAKIEGIGTNKLMIKGVESLDQSAEYSIGPDFMEVASFISLAAVTGGEMRIKNCRPQEHRMTKMIFNRLGVDFSFVGNDIIVPSSQKMKIIGEAHRDMLRIQSMPWPGFNPDLISVTIVVATQSEGQVLIHEPLFENRLVFTDKLRSMRANIFLCNSHQAVVTGRTPLYRANGGINSPDIRAGMAILIAALAAKGKSQIYNITQIDRGYESIERRLELLGARIKRLKQG